MWDFECRLYSPASARKRSRKRGEIQNRACISKASRTGLRAGISLLRFADDAEQSDDLQAHFHRFLSSHPLVGEDHVRTNLECQNDGCGFARVQYGLQAQNRLNAGGFLYDQTANGTGIDAVASIPPPPLRAGVSPHIAGTEGAPGRFARGSERAKCPKRRSTPG